MGNMEKNCLQGLKRQNKLFANTICVKKMLAGKSDNQGQKDMELGTSKWSFYNIEINDKLENS